jgi:hypothetical protein
MGTKQKTVIITGASQGIGAGVVQGSSIAAITLWTGNAEKIGEQHAGSGSGCALPKQAYARCEGDEATEIDEDLARGKTVGYRCPYRGEIALDQTQDSEANHGRRKDRMAHACDDRRVR